MLLRLARPVSPVSHAGFRGVGATGSLRSGVKPMPQTNGDATTGHVLRGIDAHFYDVGNAFFGVPLFNRKHLSLIRLQANDLVRDIGCGTAPVLCKLRRRFGDPPRFFGVDPSPDRITLARRPMRGSPRSWTSGMPPSTG